MRIVVGVDQAPTSYSVLEAAIREARIRGGELHVVSVHHAPLSLRAAGLGRFAESREERAEYHGAVWARLRPSLASSHVEFEMVEIEGDPGRALVDYAQNVAADLIVVGSRSRGDVASMMMGSTSHACLHLSPIDVLVVKPGPDTLTAAQRAGHPSSATTAG